VRTEGRSALGADEFEVRESVSHDRSRDWGRFGNARDFARHLEQTPLGHVWRVELSADGDTVALRDYFSTINDDGHVIRSQGTGDRKVAAAVDLAAAKGWNNLHVEGSHEQRLAIAVAASKQRLNVEGISPKEVELAQAQARHKRRPKRAAGGVKEWRV